MDEVAIKKKLEEFRVNKKAIEQIDFLSKRHGFDAILNIAFKNEMFDVIFDLFKPIEIDNEIRIYFDLFTYLSLAGLENFIEKFHASEGELEKIINSIYTLDIENIRKMKIGNTLPRQIPGFGHPITSRRDVIYYAEPACVEAMLSLFRNNIRTTMNDTTCACIDELENGYCTIWVDYDSLSEENRDIAQELVSIKVARFEDGKVQKTLAIIVPCTKEETVGDVSDKLRNIVNQFKWQPILYGFYTKEQMTMKMKKYIERGLYSNHFLPDGRKTYLDYCMELIENGQILENPSGNLQTEDGKIFSVDDFVNTIANSTFFVSSYIDSMGYYYDEVEEKFWESKRLYDHAQSTKQKYIKKV
jgi:hypothetical protein